MFCVTPTGGKIKKSLSFVSGVAGRRASSGEAFNEWRSRQLITVMLREGGASSIHRRAWRLLDRPPARTMTERRHARACRGHPRFRRRVLKQVVDGRNKSGHDGTTTMGVAMRTRFHMIRLIAAGV